MVLGYFLDLVVSCRVGDDLRALTGRDKVAKDERHSSEGHVGHDDLPMP